VQKTTIRLLVNPFALIIHKLYGRAQETVSRYSIGGRLDIESYCPPREPEPPTGCEIQKAGLRLNTSEMWDVPGPSELVACRNVPLVLINHTWSATNAPFTVSLVL